MNAIHINKVLTKHVKYFQGVYPNDLLPSTLIKSSICHQPRQALHVRFALGICISDCGYVECFDSYGLPPYKFEIMASLERHSISWTFKPHTLQGLTWNVCGHYCYIYALQSQGTIYDVIREPVCNCSLHLKRLKVSELVPR